MCVLKLEVQTGTCLFKSVNSWYWYWNLLSNFVFSNTLNVNCLGISHSGQSSHCHKQVPTTKPNQYINCPTIEWYNNIAQLAGDSCNTQPMLYLEYVKALLHSTTCAVCSSQLLNTTTWLRNHRTWAAGYNNSKKAASDNSFKPPLSDCPWKLKVLWLI